MTKPQSAAVEEMRFVLYRYCLSLTQSTWDAEDLVQETCLRALPIIDGALDHPNPTAYLLRTAKNIAVDQTRRKQRADRMMRVMQQNEIVMNRLYQDSPEMELILQLLIQHLSPIQRTVFLLKELFGYKNAEVATKLIMSEGAVKAALHRARAAIDRLKLADRYRYPDSNTGEPSQANESLLSAYVHAVRHSDPQALIILANAEAQITDTVQAIGQLGQRYASASTNSSSISMLFAA